MNALKLMTPAEGSNSIGLAEVKKRVTQLGYDSAAGKDALPGLASAVIQAAQGGAFTADDRFDPKGNIITSNVATDGVDFAEYLYTEFTKAESKKQVHTEGGTKANISKLRQVGKMGMMTACDPLSVVQRTIATRNRIAANNPKDVLSAYPAIVKVAREQLKLDRDINDDEVAAAIMKPEAAEKGLEEKLTQAFRILEDVIAGGYQHEAVTNAAEWLDSHCREDLGFDPSKDAKKKAKAREKAEKERAKAQEGVGAALDAGTPAPTEVEAGTPTFA